MTIDDQAIERVARRQADQAIELAALRLDVRRLSEKLAQFEPASVQQRARREKLRALIGRAGDLLGGRSWRAAGQLSELLYARTTAPGELGAIVSTLKNDTNCPKTPRNIWKYMHPPDADP